MSKNEITKSKNKKEQAIESWEDALPYVVKKNTELQRKALDVIDEKIDECNAVQAANIYSKLHGALETLVGTPKAQEGKTYNMYFADVTQGEAADLMGRVLQRMNSEIVIDDKRKGEKVIEVDAEVL